MVRVATLFAILALGGVMAPPPAAAELVFLSSGRTLSVKAHRQEGDSMVLLLRGGGEIVCPVALVVRIAPDEVPYPGPADEERPDPLPASAVRVPYADLIDYFSAEHGVDARIVRAMIQVESGYRADARSPKGAMGLMQLMPETARRWAVSDPYDPRANIEAGIKHLRSLLDRFDLSLALAAYNAGEAAVARFKGIPPYAETRTYVRDVLRLAGLASRAR